MSRKCERCGKSAEIFDSNLHLWLCNECINKEYNCMSLCESRKKSIEDKCDEEKYEEEIENILKAMEKLCNSISESNNRRIERQFKNTPYSKDLNELLSAMTRERMLKIAEVLGLKKMYKYKKKDLKEILLNSYEDALLEKLVLLDEKAFKALRRYCKSNGEKLLDDIPNEEIIYVDYFINLGTLFPVEDKQGNKRFLMPLITQKIVNKLDEFQFRLKIKNNTKIINLYKGMVRAYGLLEEYKIIEFVRQYLVEEYDYSYLLNLLRESANYTDEYLVEGVFVFNSNIDNYITLYNNINRKMKNKDYRKFSESELLSLANSNWEVDNTYAKDFKESFLSYFIMSEDEVDDFLRFLYVVVQEKNLDELLNEIGEMIQEEEAKEIGMDIIEKYVVNLPIWTNKGRCMKELKLNNI